MNASDKLLRVVQQGMSECRAGLLSFVPVEDMMLFTQPYVGRSYERDAKLDLAFDNHWEPPRNRRQSSENQVAPKRPPPWFVGLASGFIKDVENIDKKLQGRILEAITALTKDPLTPRGDTIKPLSGEFAGYWRYRIGDHRLIYAPDREAGNLTLLAFASRGSVYD